MQQMHLGIMIRDQTCSESIERMEMNDEIKTKSHKDTKRKQNRSESMTCPFDTSRGTAASAAISQCQKGI